MTEGVLASNNKSLSQKMTDLLQRKPVILQLLRFVAIGVLNTALDFLILNFFTQAFNIKSGFGLGSINVPGFLLAVVQSYFWNKYWTFGSTAETISAVKNFFRLVLVGVIGFLAFVLAVLGAKMVAPAYFYLFVLVIYVIIQVVILHSFGFFGQQSSNQKGSFLPFFLVSVVGLIINSVLLALVSNQGLVANEQLNVNIAKIVATFGSLIWNFIGYKLIVFK